LKLEDLAPAPPILEAIFSSSLPFYPPCFPILIDRAHFPQHSTFLQSKFVQILVFSGQYLSKF